MGSLTKEYSEQKTQGRIYTPAPLVARILDAAEYFGGNICDARILDPACGDGEFLVEAVRRIVEVTPREELASALTLVHGWDLDEAAIEQCRARLDEIVEPFGVSVDWNVRVRNALDICLRDDLFQQQQEFFRFVVGNPPYVRIQHLSKEDRARVQSHFKFCASGSTDLYVAFFELALSLLEPNGTVALITPNTYFHTSTGRDLRRHLVEKRLLRHVVNFGYRQMFPNATTYAAITVAVNSPSDCFDYVDASGAVEKQQRVLASQLSSQDVWRFNAASETSDCKRYKPLKEIARIHVGLATLADSVFVVKGIDNDDAGIVRVKSKHFGVVSIERDLLRPVIKGSLVKAGEPCYKEDYILFPYQLSGARPALIREEEMAARFPLGYAYLLKARELLDKRDNGKTNSAGWYAFGRTQALISSFGEKIICPPIAKKPNFAVCCMKEATVYSGYFIKYGGDLEALARQLNSERMQDYVQSGGRDYQGGWKGYSKASMQDFPIDVSQL